MQFRFQSARHPHTKTTRIHHKMCQADTASSKAFSVFTSLLHWGNTSESRAVCSKWHRRICLVLNLGLCLAHSLLYVPAPHNIQIHWRRLNQKKKNNNFAYKKIVCCVRMLPQHIILSYTVQVESKRITLALHEALVVGLTCFGKYLK